MKKMILVMTLLIVLGMLSAGLWVYFAFLYTKPLSKSELAELTPDWSAVTHGNWSPWFDPGDGTTEWNPAASFNAWLATVPEEDKAWGVLVDVQYGGSELYNCLEVGSFPEDVEDWGKIVALCELDESKEMIHRLKEALQLPMMGAGLYDGTFTTTQGRNLKNSQTRDPVEFAALERYGLEDIEFVPSEDPNPNLLNTGLSSLGSQRGIVNIFRTSSIFELERGQVDEFLELVTLSMDSARFTEEFPTLISQLVAMAIESHGNKTIEWALEHHPEAFTDEHLRMLDQLVSRHQHRTFLWQGEAMGFHDSIRRTVDDSGSLKMAGARTLQGGGGSFDTPTNLPDSQLHASAQRTLYAYNKMLAQAQVESSLPRMTNGSSAMEILESEKKNLNYLGSRLLDILSPAIDRASESFRMLQQESVDLRMTIAAHRHALRHGQLPESNEAIDEDLLPD
jgi:hypothetical protein